MCKKKPINEIGKRTNLMDWWVHRISTNWAFKKFMDTGGAGINNWRYSDVIVGVVIMRLRDRRKRMVMVMDLIFICHFWRRNAFNAIQLHSYNKKEPEMINLLRSPFDGYNPIGIFNAKDREKRTIGQRNRCFPQMGNDWFMRSFECRMSFDEDSEKG